MPTKPNRLYHFIANNLLTPSEQLNAEQFQPKLNSKGKKYYLYPLKKIKKTLVADQSKYKLKNHHVSIYEDENRSNSQRSQTHYTAAFTGEDNEEYQAHVYFDDQEEVVDVTFALKRENGSLEPREIASPFKADLVKNAQDFGLPHIERLRGDYETVMIGLEDKYDILEFQLNALSMDLDNNREQYQQFLEQTISTLKFLWPHHERYDSLLRLFRRMKLVSQPPASIRSTREEEKKPTQEDQADEKVVLEEKLPGPKKSVEEFIQRAVAARNTYLEEEKATSKEKLALVLDLTLKTQDALMMTEDENYEVTQIQLWRINHLMKACKVYGKKVLVYLLLDGDFESALSLKGYTSSLRLNIYLLAAKRANHALFGFLFEHLTVAGFEMKQFRKMFKSLNASELIILYPRLEAMLTEQLKRLSGKYAIYDLVDEESAKDYLYRIVQIMGEVSQLRAKVLAFKPIEGICASSEVIRFKNLLQELDVLRRSFNLFLDNMTRIVNKHIIKDKDILKIWRSCIERAEALNELASQNPGLIRLIDGLNPDRSRLHSTSRGTDTSQRHQGQQAQVELLRDRGLMRRHFIVFIAAVLRLRLQFLGLKPEELRHIADHYLSPLILKFTTRRLKANLAPAVDLSLLSRLMAERIMSLMVSLSDQDMERIFFRFKQSAHAAHNLSSLRGFLQTRKLNAYQFFKSNPQNICSNPEDLILRSKMAWEKIDAEIWQCLLVDPFVQTCKWSFIVFLAALSREQEFPQGQFILFLISIVIFPCLYVGILNNQGGIDFNLPEEVLDPVLDDIGLQYAQPYSNEELRERAQDLKEIVCLSVQACSPMDRFLAESLLENKEALASLKRG